MKLIHIYHPNTLPIIDGFADLLDGHLVTNTRTSSVLDDSSVHMRLYTEFSIRLTEITKFRYDS